MAQDTEIDFDIDIFEEENGPHSLINLGLSGDKLKEQTEENIVEPENSKVSSTDSTIKGVDFVDLNSDLETAVVDVVIDRVRSVTLRAPINVEGQDISAVVDTGAEVTVMSETLFFKIPENRRPCLKKASRNLVVAEAGKKMRSLGVADVSIVIGPLEFSWPVYVAPIGDLLLLGCDVIDEKDITINTRRGLEISGQWISCDVHRQSDKVARVLLKESVTVPPNSEVVMEGRSVNSEILDTRYGSIEPVFEDERKILVARCLIDPYKSCVPVRLVNLENFPVKVRKNYVLGEIHPVNSFEKFSVEEGSQDSVQCNVSRVVNENVLTAVKQGDPVISPNIPSDWNCFKVSESENLLSHTKRANVDLPVIPDHLVDLYSRSCEKLTDNNHKVKLAEVLIKKSECFCQK